MQDTTRFDIILDLLNANEDIELDIRDDIVDHLEALQQRLLELRKFVYMCLVDGWTDNDLRLIRGWIVDQGERTRIDDTAIATIDALIAEGAPVPTGIIGGAPLPPEPPRDVWTAFRMPANTANITGIGNPEPTPAMPILEPTDIAGGVNPVRNATRPVDPRIWGNGRL